jgi:hypothetical protein
LPSSRGAVVHRDFFSEVFAFAVGSVPIHRYGVGGKLKAHDVDCARNILAGVLVEGIGGIICSAEICAVFIAAGFGLGAVADVVERVLKLLTGNRGPVGPEFFGGGELTEGIV